MTQPNWIYLDNNATTMPDPRVVEAMDRVQRELWANPSSVHRFGQAVRQAVELARSQVARLVGVREREIIFTSGGTEANNLALRGVLEAAPQGVQPVLITTAIEHAAIREPAEFLQAGGVRVVQVPIDGDGFVEPASLTAALEAHAGPGTRPLVSIQWANNETGVIQDVLQLSEVVREYRQRSGVRLALHVDATQAVGKLPVDAKAAGVDLLTLAGHKFHGPKGVGALVVRSTVRLRPQQRGGPQERDRRGGTENTAGIVGLGVAAQLAAEFLAQTTQRERLAAMRDRFERAIRAALPQTVVHSAGRPRLWNTSNLGFAGLEAEAILLGLSEQGVCASAGAACSSGSLDPSPVLLAMGVPEPVAHGSVRFSLSRFTRDPEIDQAIAIVPQVVRKLARTLPVG